MRSKAVEYAEEYAEKFFVTDDNELLSDPFRYQAWKAQQLEVMSDHQKLMFFFNHFDALVYFFFQVHNCFRFSDNDHTGRRRSMVWEHNSRVIPYQLLVHK